MSKKSKGYDAKRLASIKKLHYEGKTSRAYREIKDYLEDYPDNEFAKYLYAKILVVAGEKEEAKRIFQSIAYSKSNNRYSAASELATLFYYEDKFDKAEKISLAIIDEAPDKSSSALLILAKIRYIQGKITEVEELLNRVPLKNSNDIIETAKYFSLINYRKKSDRILKSLNLDELGRESLLKVAQIKKQNDKFEEAFNIIKRIKDTSKRDNFYFRVLKEEAYIFNKLGYSDKAIDNILEALGSNLVNDEEELYLILGEAYTKKADYKSAKKNLEIVLQSSHKVPRYHAVCALGKLEYLSGNLEEAKLIFQSCLEQDHNDYFPLLQLITIEIKQENYLQAEEYLKKLEENYSVDNLTSSNTLTFLKLSVDKKLNKDIVSLGIISYREKLIIDYNDESVIEHIKNRHGKESSTTTSFNQSIDIESLYYETKEKLTEENICYGNDCDIYLIDYKNIGNEENMDRYKVVVIPNTKDIITMYPIPNEDKKEVKVSEFLINKQKEELKQQENFEKKYAKYYRK